MLQFSNAPGPRERHLQRKYNNPLFSGATEITQHQIGEAQQQDSAALQQFMEQFREVVQQAVKLDKTVESDIILKLKAQLEQQYSLSTGLQGHASEISEAIRKLIGAIASTLREGSANDMLALEKLEKDEEHTTLHLYLSDFSIVSDLLNPEQLFTVDDLIPSLLNEGEESLQAALALFPPENIAAMIEMGTELLNKIEADGHSLPDAWQRLAQMEKWLREI